MNINDGNKLVKAIKPLASATTRRGCKSVIGGFGGLFDMDAAGYKDPLLVSGTDGVGTKLKVRATLSQSNYTRPVIGKLHLLTVQCRHVEGGLNLCFQNVGTCFKASESVLKI